MLVSTLISCASVPVAAADPAPPPTGAELFRQRWVVAPSAFGLWGRGPLSNAEACSDCHASYDRGTIPSNAGAPLQSAIVRLSVRTPEGVVTPHPTYGTQLQTQGVLGRVPPEGEVRVHWQARRYRYPDGRAVRLRWPRLEFRELAHGPLDGVLTSLRIPPALAGTGDLEAIADQALVDHERRRHASGKGGRLHRVMDAATGLERIGRFGWKATQPTLEHQTAIAFLEDLGVTSPRHPHDNCMPAQRECLAETPSAYPEISADGVTALVDHLRTISRPPPLPHRTRGARLFDVVGCADCHVPAWTIESPDSGPAKRIAPYTDLMLHDLGDALADGRPEGEAGPREWRTAPLWGIGRLLSADRRPVYLHDGRARSVEEAILWHGGEAEPARRRFVRLSAADRATLLRFVRTR